MPPSISAIWTLDDPEDGGDDEIHGTSHQQEGPQDFLHSPGRKEGESHSSDDSNQAVCFLGNSALEDCGDFSVDGVGSSDLQGTSVDGTSEDVLAEGWVCDLFDELNLHILADSSALIPQYLHR